VPSPFIFLMFAGSDPFGPTQRKLEKQLFS